MPVTLYRPKSSLYYVSLSISDQTTINQVNLINFFVLTFICVL